MIAAERPESWGGLIDLAADDRSGKDPSGSHPPTPVLDDTTTRRLLATLAGATDEDEIALRADNAWTRRLRPAPPPRPAAPGSRRAQPW